MVFPIAAILVLAALVLRPDTLARLRDRLWTKAVADKALSIGAVIAALVVLLHGDVWVAFCLFGLSLWLLGRSSGFAVRRPSAAHPSPTLTRSESVEIAIDSATGRRSARMIAGAHRGAVLDQLGLDGCLPILASCRQADPAGARLLEDYLDARAPLWRQAADRHEDAGPRPRTRLAGKMTEEQAYQLFGLARGAPREAVVRAHRTLMKKWHPDQGGTAELAALANEAKEVLLRRHG